MVDTGEIHRGPLLADIARLERELSIALSATEGLKKNLVNRAAEGWRLACEACAKGIADTAPEDHPDITAKEADSIEVYGDAWRVCNAVRDQGPPE